MTGGGRIWRFGFVRKLVRAMPRGSKRVIGMNRDDCHSLLASLDDTREYLRTVTLSHGSLPGDGDPLGLSEAFYRVGSAAATIRWLLKDNSELQRMVSSLSGTIEAATDSTTHK